MPQCQPVTETIILQLKEGGSVEGVASGTGASSSPEVQAFVKWTETVESQQGFLRHLWVIGLYLALSMRKLKCDIGSSSQSPTHLCLVCR